MFRDLLSSIDGIETYPIISLILFFLVFVGVIVWIFTTNKEIMNRYAMIPLDKERKSNKNNFEIKND